MDDTEIEVALDQIWRLVLTEGKPLSVALELSHVSRSTFYGWAQEIRDRVKADVAKVVIAQRDEEQQVLLEAKRTHQLRIDERAMAFRLRAIELAEQGIEVLNDIINDANETGFTRVTAISKLMEMAKTDFDPAHTSRTLVIDQREQEGQPLPALPEASPRRRTLPVLQDLQPADRIDLPLEVQHREVFVDGTVKTETIRRADVVDPTT